MRGEGPRSLVKAIGEPIDIDRCHREAECALGYLFHGRRNPDNSPHIEKTTPIHKNIQSYGEQFDVSMKIASYSMARERVPEKLWLCYDRFAGQSSSPRVKARSCGGGIVKCTFGSRPGITQWPESDLLVAQMMHPIQSPKRSDRSRCTSSESHDTLNNKSYLQSGRRKGCNMKEVLDFCEGGLPDNNSRDDIPRNVNKPLHQDQGFRGSPVKCSNNLRKRAVGGRSRPQALSFNNNISITARKETQKHGKVVVTSPSHSRQGRK